MSVKIPSCNVYKLRAAVRKQAYAGSVVVDEYGGLRALVTCADVEDAIHIELKYG